MNEIIRMPVTMSSLEIAELTGKRHDHVVRDIRAMLRSLDTNAPSFGGVYTDAKGEDRPCFNLPKDLTLTLVAGYSAPLRHRIIVRWMELEAAAPTPTQIEGRSGAVSEIDSIVTDLSPDAARRFGGIVKGVVHKQVSEVVAAQFHAFLERTLPDAIKQALVANQAVVTVGFKSALQVAEDNGIHKRTQNLTVHLGNALEKYAADRGMRIERAWAPSGRKGTRLFPVQAIDEWCQSQAGSSWLAKRNAGAIGQGVLQFPSARRKGRG